MQAFYEAGLAWYEAGKKNMAFVMLNRFLDLSDAMDEPDSSAAVIENADFADTDIPYDFNIPDRPYANEAQREEVRPVPSCVLGLLGTAGALGAYVARITKNKGHRGYRGQACRLAGSTGSRTMDPTHHGFCPCLFHAAPVCIHRPKLTRSCIVQRLQHPPPPS